MNKEQLNNFITDKINKRIILCQDQKILWKN